MTAFRQRLLGAVVIVLVIGAVNALAIQAMFRWSTDAPLGFALGVTAMLAFVGMLALSQETDGTWRITEATMRTAIASALVAEYVSLISMVAFSAPQQAAISPVTQTMISSFTTIIGVVMAFYFGASAYVEGKRISANRRPDDEARRED